MSLIVARLTTPLGLFEVSHDEQHLIYSAFLRPVADELTRHKLSHLEPIKLCEGEHSPLTDLIIQELTIYFQNPQHRFHLPLKPIGSTYQLRVWQHLLTIPAGQTTTYGHFAKSIQSSPRAVGQACKTNPLALFIPCHRVVSQSGLGGYMGHVNAIMHKKNLLIHEGAKIPNLGGNKLSQPIFS